MISCVIPAYNEERWLPATLDALAAALRDLDEASEVIVVDDASTDRTAAIAAAHGACVVSVSHRQIAATRNAGARMARGDRLAFIDADTLVDADVLRAALAAMRGGAIGGGAGVRFDGEVPRYARVLLPVLVRAFRALHLAAGCFVFCTKGAFDAAGGFDERLYAAEELALSRALKRQGPFVVLREAVKTSGRKLRTHSARDILRMLLGVALRGRGALASRNGLELWYDGRRDG